MTDFFLKRLLAGLLTLFVVINLTFVLIRLMPGGPFDKEHATSPQIMQNLEAKYHLNEPLYIQYGIYIKNLLHGDLGPSYYYKSRTVNDIVSEAFGYSFLLGGLAMILGVGLGILLGTVAGMTRNLQLDGALSLLGVSSLSIPSFIFGGLLVLLFALQLNWLPAATLQTPRHYILPVITLSLVPFAYTFLLVRTAVRETRAQVFVLVKRSFGVQAPTVALRHVLRNSLVPLVSILGPIAAALVTGSFAVEYIFAVPGLGKHFVNAVSNRDYTLIMGITLLYSVVLIVFNTLTDILYGFLDPRLRGKSKLEGA